MAIEPDSNWWFFQILGGPDDALVPEMVLLPALPSERTRHDISYHAYLQLDKVLAAQRPLTRVPDERAFVIVHQLFELAFKLMLFDFAVVERALADVLHIDDDVAFRYATRISDKKPERKSLARDARDRWTPALTASARILYSAKELLPKLFGIVRGEVADIEPGSDIGAVAAEPEREEFPALTQSQTFNSTQFERFRFRLPPASGFQSAQFRAVQRAFGKSRLLTLKIFDIDGYDHHYRGVPTDPRTPGAHRLTTVDDPDILRDQAAVAAPSTDSPAAAGLRLTETARALLTKLGLALGTAPMDDDVDNAALIGDVSVKFRAMVAPAKLKDEDERVAAFERDLQDALAVPPEERAEEANARGAFRRLVTSCPKNPIVECLRRVMLADGHLFTSASSPFLHEHRVIARNAGLGYKDPGTAGGGMDFLRLSIALHLLFPALRFVDPK